MSQLVFWSPLILEISGCLAHRNADSSRKTHIKTWLDGAFKNVFLAAIYWSENRSNKTWESPDTTGSHPSDGQQLPICERRIPEIGNATANTFKTDAISAYRCVCAYIYTHIYTYMNIYIYMWMTNIHRLYPVNNGGSTMVSYTQVVVYYCACSYFGKSGWFSSPMIRMRWVVAAANPTLPRWSLDIHVHTLRSMIFTIWLWLT